eukprot:2681281-Amphidinium_carterae.1
MHEDSYGSQVALSLSEGVEFECLGGFFDRSNFLAWEVWTKMFTSECFGESGSRIAVRLLYIHSSPCLR